MSKENYVAQANHRLKEEFGSAVTVKVSLFLADLGDDELSETFIWQDELTESEPYFTSLNECYQSARTYLAVKHRKVDRYFGSLEQVKDRIYVDYAKNDMELCSFFASTAPHLTIEETIRLYAQLRHQIDGDRTISIVEEAMIDLTDDSTLSTDDLEGLLRCGGKSDPQSENYKRYEKQLLSTICLGDLIRMSDMLTSLCDLITEPNEIVEDAKELSEEIDTKLMAFQTGKPCGRCGLPLYLSDLPQYSETCYECDMNF